MQQLPGSIVERLRRDLDRSYVVEDLELRPQELPSLSGFLLAEESAAVDVERRVVQRVFRLHSSAATPATVRIGLTLGVDGVEPAFQDLLTCVGGFQRPIPVGDVVFPQDAPLSFGDAGLGWSWSGGDVEVLLSMRRNVLTTVSGSAGTDLTAVAAEIDGLLAQLAHVGDPGASPYYESRLAALEELRGQSVPVGGVLDLPVPDGYELYGQVDVGSLNRDPADPTRRYYRAGLDPQEDVGVDLLMIADGIVPRGIRLRLHIVA